MPRPNINEIVGNQDFATLFRWEVIFSELPNAIANAGLYNATALNTHAISSEYPRFTNDEIEVGIHGHKVYQAGIRTYDPITLTLIEDNNALIQKFIRDWGALLWTPGTGTQANKSDYVCRSIILRPLKNDNAGLFTYTLKNCWMQSHTIGNPDGATNELIRPEITLRFDYFLTEGQSV